ncbi:MAG: trifunctional glycosyltransferase/class I SAM-dependent methyltransferase/polysaccharide deacetylase [Pseudomonadota bacterium]
MSVNISIIMPAFNAAKYLNEAVESLTAQTVTNWELIIVDDGSSDDTLAIAKNWAEDDARIRVLEQSNAGASAARNTGLKAATGKWVAFVDSDDWVHKDFLKALHKPLKRGGLDGVFCISVDVLSDGSLGKHWVPAPTDALFPVYATDCPIAIHGIMVRRDLVMEVGGWDTDLSTCEDWDLWMRLARTKAKFTNVMEVLSYIRIRTGSLSRSMPKRLARDGVIVIERANGPDPRVPNPDPKWENGLPTPDMADRIAQHLIWAAALNIASGGDGMEILQAYPGRFETALEPYDLAATIWDAISHTTGDMADDWTAHTPRVQALLTELAKLSETPDLELRTFKALELMIFQYAWLDEPVAFGETFWISHDLEEPIQAIRVPEGLKQLACVVFSGETRIGMVQLDVRDGGVSANRLARAVAERFGGKLVYQKLRHGGASALSLLTPIAGAALRRKVVGFGLSLAQMKRHSQYDRLKTFALETGPGIALKSGLITVADGSGVHLEPKVIGAGSGKTHASDDTVFMPHDEDYGTEYWETVFANQNPWDYDNSYEQTKYDQTIDLLPKRSFDRALELACAEGHFTQMLAPLVGELVATDISDTALKRASEACASHTNISYQQLDLKKGEIPGTFDLIVCSEVLYYFESRKDLKMIAQKLAKHLAPGGLILMAHGNISVNAPKETGFDWEHPFDARSIGEIFAADPALTLVQEAWSDIYGIQLLQAKEVSSDTAMTPSPAKDLIRSLDLTYYVSSQIEWNGAAWHKKTLVSDELPILTYHRVSSEPGPAPLEPYRVRPAQFEAQLRYFVNQGYHGVTLDAWQTERARWRGMPGKALAITFDDGFDDFYHEAFPILQKYGFPVTVFVVSDLVGKTAQWDARYGNPAPLMTWEKIKELSNMGVQFGSHTATHPLLGMLNPEEVRQEARRSKQTIEDQIGQRVTSVAYPFGDYSEVVCRIFEDEGYTLGLTTAGDPAALAERPMETSRIELAPTDGPIEIAMKLPTPRPTNALRHARLAVSEKLTRLRYDLF